MWNTWSRTTKATDFTTRKTGSHFTKRWKNSSINICTQPRRTGRTRAARDCTSGGAHLGKRAAIPERDPRTQKRLSWLSLLCLNDRRRNIFGYPGIAAAAQFAVADAVAEINQHPDCEPDEEAAPGFQRQTQHERGAKKYAENRKQRYERHAERTRAASVRAAENNYAEANEYEGKEGADIGEISKRSDVSQHGNTPHRDACPNRGDIRRTETVVNSRKILRQQAVPRHGHENARLAELKDKQNRSQACQSSGTDECLGPWFARERRRHRR